MVLRFTYFGDIAMATEPTKPSLQRHHGKYTWTSYWRCDLNKLRTKRFKQKDEATKREVAIEFQTWRDQEWKKKDQVRNPDGGAATYMCHHLGREYLEYANSIYVKNGKPTSHIWQVKYALDALSKLVKPASAIDSPELARLRDSMIYGERIGKDGKPQKYLRSAKTINGRLQIIKEAFSWARERGKVPRAVYLDLLSVKPLRAGRSAAKPPERVLPIAWPVALRTMACATKVIGAMIRLSYLCDMRPGEVCNLRACDIDMSGDVWIYSPWTSKMEHKGIDRKIAIGPLAQAVLGPFLSTCTTAFLFTPEASEEERIQALRAARATKRAEKKTYPSWVARYAKMAAARVRRTHAPKYTEASYRNAIHYACENAKIAPWNPNQLRHTRATEIRAAFGLQAASDALGHTNMETSKIYAEQSLERAIEIARKIG